MSTSANPSPGSNSNARRGNINNGRKSNAANVNSAGAAALATDNSVVVAPTQTVLGRFPSSSLVWTHEEQSVLENLLARSASEPNIARYALISNSLRDKSVRDVALRCRWMSFKESRKRRNDDNSRKSKDKELVTDSLPRSSQAANRSNSLPYAQSMDSDDDRISFKAIGGAAGQLLEQNAQALDQISANFSACKIHENLNLFCQARSNILSILNDTSDMPETMKHMPPLPVELNEDLANHVLPRTFPPRRH